MVTEIVLDELVPANPDDNGGNLKSFTWKNIVTRYNKRSAKFELLNVYQYCALHWKKIGTTIPRLFGYHDRPTWPLSEIFSLWTLSLFKPCKVKCTEVIGDKETYALELAEYMYIDDFPAKIRYIILRAKRNDPDLEITYVYYIVGNRDQESTPTTDCRNQVFEEIADVERGPENEDEDYEEMNDFQFDSLDNNIPPNYDWSAGYLPSLAKSLVELKNNYYKYQE